MPIRMPNYEELSAEQLAILEGCALDENLMIVGPPGTGKTIIAMWRAKQLCGDELTKATLLMHGKVLVSYSGQWEEQSKNVSVKTYHKWTWGMWMRNFHHKPPTLPEDKWAYDWDEMQVEALDSTDFNLGHVIIDEAQDFSPAFYNAIGMFTGSCDEESTACIAADENQRLQDDDNSTLSEIRDGLKIFTGELTEMGLTKNYRNTKQIGALAGCFYVGLTTGKPEMPDRTGAKPRVTEHSNKDSMAQAISTYAKNNPGQSILVICPSPRVVKNIFKSLNKHLKGTKKRVQGYVNQKYLHGDEELATGDPNVITCVHWRSMKGLESDAVFTPVFEEHEMGHDGNDDEMMRFYVMFSRARSHLEIQFSAGTPSNNSLKSLLHDKCGSLLKWNMK